MKETAVRYLASLSWVILFLVLAAPSAHAVSGIGASLGVTFYDPAEGFAKGTTGVTVPAHSNLSTGIGPGLRLSVAGERIDHEGYVDFGIDSYSSGGDAIRVVRVAGNYQYNFTARSSRPYLTAGIGLLSTDVSDGDSGSSLTFGGGAGLGYPVSDGAGRLRIEARVDHLQGSGGGEDKIIPEANAFQVIFGFDLWIR